MSTTKVQHTSSASYKSSKKHKLADSAENSSKKRRLETAQSTGKETANAEAGDEQNIHASRRSSKIAGDNKEGVLNGKISSLYYSHQPY